MKTPVLFFSSKPKISFVFPPVPAPLILAYLMFEIDCRGDLPIVTQPSRKLNTIGFKVALMIGRPTATKAPNTKTAMIKAALIVLSLKPLEKAFRNENKTTNTMVKTKELFIQRLSMFPLMVNSLDGGAFSTSEKPCEAFCGAFDSSTGTWVGYIV